MSILKTFATDSATIGGLSATVAVTLEKDDASGQVFFRVVGTINGATYERRHSVGSDDGNDALAGLDQAAMAVAVQRELDALRQKMAAFLGRQAALAAAVQRLV